VYIPKFITPKRIAAFIVSVFLFKFSNSQEPRAILAPYSTTIKKNYVRTWDATAPENDPMLLMTKQLTDVKQATQYLDGFARPLQLVSYRRVSHRHDQC
jgi:hypothetical protein